MLRFNNFSRFSQLLVKYSRMVYSTEDSGCSVLPKKKNIIALETSLHQSLSNFKELILDFEQLQIESENYKAQVLIQKEKCDSKTCISSESLKKDLEIKDHIIQSVASTLTRLNDTKDLSIISEAFKILCGEVVTPPKENVKNTLETPKKECTTSVTDECDDDSMIEGTPTGRISPVILSKKLRNTTSSTASDCREKKKCPDSWVTPESKAVKLSFPTPSRSKTGGKLRQTRFTLVKRNSVVDLTSSPEFSGGCRARDDDNNIQLKIKKEPMNDEDIIQPSPTSVTSNFSTLCKPHKNSPLKLNKSSPLKLNKSSPCKTTKNSPSKFKKRPQMSRLQIKSETELCDTENKVQSSDRMEDSINLLRPVNRFRTPERSPPKVRDPDETDCEVDASMALLRPLCKQDEGISPENKAKFSSPTKRPLAENINCTNLQTQYDTEPGTPSILGNKPTFMITKELSRPELKRDREPFNVETIFKEPMVRKKAEKWALPGWSCDECRNFYAELYKDNPEMLAKKMEECSKHRGKNNPVRPKTPPGFWEPRWDVPEDTEEFNRRNNAV